MENLNIESLELELLKGLEDSSNAKELYEITSTYNAYTILFLKLKNEFENKNYIINNYYSNSLCYKNSIE